ncbi:MAG: exodeoxyribonuclease VII large subunit [Chitinivibrionales bacterium]|nr:exodeoxyribonuclease VII large subunit [Chitinivibrionales bacterium]
MITPLKIPQECAQPYSVADINQAVGEMIEQGNTLVWVQGELSNFKQASSGHCYFTLKDKQCRIPAVIWRSVLPRIKFTPDDGMEVMVIANLRVYQRGGYYQLDVSRMQPSGQGALYAAFEALKKKLSAEGLFDDIHKKPLPESVRRIGVVTSKQGAAFRDIIKVLSVRAPQTDIVLSSVPVQGDGAATAIAQAIDTLNAYGNISCLIVGRGGGSIEDLWPFNEECVARAIFRSAIPVISAVGHEIDFTIADFVADVRAPTPSSAAETAVPDTRENERYFANLSKRFAYRITGYMRDCFLRYGQARARPALRKPVRLLLEYRQQIDNLHDRRTRAAVRTVVTAKTQIAHAASRLQDLSPLNVLARGYSVVQKKSGESVTRCDQLVVGEEVRLRLHKGEAHGTVSKITPAISRG